MRGTLANDYPPVCKAAGTGRREMLTSEQINRLTKHSCYSCHSSRIASSASLWLPTLLPIFSTWAPHVICLTTVSSWASCLPSDYSPRAWLYIHYIHEDQASYAFFPAPLLPALLSPIHTPCTWPSSFSLISSSIALEIRENEEGCVFPAAREIN